MRKSMILLWAVWALVGKRAEADEWDWNRLTEISLTPDYSYGQTYSPLNPAASSRYQNNDLFLIFNTQLRATSGGFSAELRPELRAVASDTGLGSAARASVQAPPRPLNLQWNLGSEDRHEAIVSFERLVLTYQMENTEVSVGRKPVGIGVLSVFPVWNKFSRPLMTAFGPLVVFGQDRALIRYQSGAWAVQAMDIETSRAEEASRFAETVWYGENIEAHILAGSWFESGTLGFAITGDLGGTSLRFEEISFSGHGVQAGLGAERAFNEKWSGLMELLYLEEGAADKDRYLSLPASKLRPLLAKAYGFARAEYKPWDLWIFQTGYLMNFIDASGVVNAKVVHSLTNESDLSLEWRHPLGSDGAEFSPKLLPGQLLANWRWAF